MKVTVEKNYETIADMTSDMECVDCEYSSRCGGTGTCMSTVLANILIDMTGEGD